MMYKIEVSLSEILKIFSKNHKTGDISLIQEAYGYAEGKHQGVKRATGEPYICHPLRVARFIAEWGFEMDVIIAALLHDVVEDCGTPLSEIEEYFGPEAASTVDAVTKLSDRDFADRTLTKEQKDILSDAHMQKKMNDKALYVKIADRIDNLNTLYGMEEYKRIPKAAHTREIIIPLAIQAEAYHFVDILESLCFQTEHSKLYEGITQEYSDLCIANNKSCQESLGILTSVFNPHVNHESRELDKYHHYICNFYCDTRSPISLYRQVSNYTSNIREWPVYLKKSTTPLYDFTLIVSDELSEPNSGIQPGDIFFEYYEKALSDKGFYLINRFRTSHNDTGYYLLADEMDNLYRMFVRTETDYQRYLYGNIVDSHDILSLGQVNEIDPRDTYKEKIKIFGRNGSAMFIDKGATVLDFAFQIGYETGCHFSHAVIEESQAKLSARTLLNDGDVITIVTDANIHPELSWFMYTRTALATRALICYFEKAGVAPAGL